MVLEYTTTFGKHEGATLEPSLKRAARAERVPPLTASPYTNECSGFAPSRDHSDGVAVERRVMHVQNRRLRGWIRAFEGSQES